MWLTTYFKTREIIDNMQIRWYFIPKTWEWNKHWIEERRSPWSLVQKASIHQSAMVNVRTKRSRGQIIQNLETQNQPLNFESILNPDYI